MVVKCSPSTPTIRVRILLTSTVSSVKFEFEKNKNKELGDGPFVTGSINNQISQNSSITFWG